MPRATVPVELPGATQRFLRTARGRRAQRSVLRLHRWLAGRQLSLDELTPDHLRAFGARRPRGPGPHPAALDRRVRDYLQWLYERKLLHFDPVALRRQPRPLPAPAREFLASLTPTHRPSTCWGYTGSLREFHHWLAQRGLDLQRLTRRDLLPWFHDLHAAGLQPMTRRMSLIKVRVYLRWFAEHHRMQTAADDLIRPHDLPKPPVYLPRPLTLEADRELQRRLAAADDRCALALLLMRRTGLRIGELRSLEYHCLRADHAHPLLKVPLGKLNSERLVPLEPQAVELVRRLQALAPRPRAWLVATLDGARISYGTLTRALAAFSHELPDPVPITSHRLRHTYATELLSAGMSLLGVMRLLGHRDYRMTLRYTAITPETVATEYHKALALLAAKYQLPTAPAPARALDPDQLLDYLARWLRKHTPSQPRLRALLKRIARLKHALRDRTAASDA